MSFFRHSTASLISIVVFLITISAVRSFSPNTHHDVSSIARRQHARSASAFSRSPSTPFPAALPPRVRATETSLHAIDAGAAATNAAAALIGSPAVLLVPVAIGALVASLLAWFIIGYANPETEDYMEDDIEYD
uniref:PSII 6.1 kDa protein n=1 Tax=Corethron hystrix TaxID=216773 RepID=A0A7S1FTL5_9STRA|mmetsp:Transcript_30839/g.70554  ORF Transcript_30839/g.70554 Transcript_30839/m.70554 type:complete len:134 (+) Transcript_30839:351-752(+)|eukprot:CAMPEP_0113309496 /NCGR_PEP_ID=MMETSP0010_2-20120614/7514_1 /TAXON_ID=216773 ORGANISM="Corethron hystrix, Strain 308" /NCGR_SAMPLE_ID=MMETSP0010_2 /ASSEMBLY_ACC=CAM_ASM_000155 /LENGTH=133 /DNA_ID=CAMNT_0000164755 /DNA_START=128 /DNA_END=529 /DNA_ORIENTATION=+ /assembly_acc=CAM_ASM_000155